MFNVLYFYEEGTLVFQYWNYGFIVLQGEKKKGIGQALIFHPDLNLGPLAGIKD